MRTLQHITFTTVEKSYEHGYKEDVAIVQMF